MPNRPPPRCRRKPRLAIIAAGAGGLPLALSTERVPADDRISTTNSQCRDPTTGTLQGFDIDLAREIARDLFGDPANVEFRLLTSTGRFEALDNNEVDLVVHATSITCERAARVGFSTVYFEAFQRLLVPKGSGISSPADLVLSVASSDDHWAGDRHSRCRWVPGRVPFVCTTNVPTMTGCPDDDDDTGSLVGTVTVRSFIDIDGGRPR